MTQDRQIDTFFKKCRLGGGVPWSLFWKEAEKRDKQCARTLYEVISGRANGSLANPYPLKNHSLGLANLVASQYDLERLKAVAKWILNEKFDFSRGALEIGCDNGLLLCLLASFHPECRFVGIDACAEAIALGKTRATALQLNNVEFIHREINSTTASLPDRTFGVVIANTVFHEVVDFYRFHAQDTESPYALQQLFGITTLDEMLQNVDLEVVGELVAIRALLDNEGLFVTADRCPSHMELLEWVRIVERHGFSMSLQRSCQLAYRNNEFLESKEEIIPVSVFAKHSNASRVGANDILGLKAHRSFGSTPFLLSCHEDATAEALYSAFSKDVAYSHCARYHDRSGVEKFEIGLAGALVYVYRATSLRFRWLLLLPLAAFHEHHEGIQDIYRTHKSAATLTDVTSNDLLLSRIGLMFDPFPTQVGGTGGSESANR